MASNVNLAPVAKLQFNQNGVPLSGGLLFTYAAGTMNKQATYTDSTGVTPNTNPIVLDANGQCGCWMQQGLAYKLILSPSTDTDPPTNPYWTVDNIHGVNDLVSTYGVDTGVANAYAVSLNPAPAALEDGQVVLFQAANTNTAASTLNLNGLGAKPLLSGGAALGPGVIVAGGVYEVVYNAAMASYLLVAQSEGAMQATSGPGATPFALRNRIINGAMAVDQRNSGSAQTITAGAALAYTVDRWWAACTGANVTGQQVAGPTGTPYVYQFTGAASVTGIQFGQRIEAYNSADMAGSEAVLSVALANSLLTSVTWAAYYANTTDSFGTLASPTKTQIATGTFTVNSTLTRYQVPIAIPAAATTGIEIVFSVGAQTSGTWQVGTVQIESVGNNTTNPTATPFERRPYGMELALCQRYYEVVSATLGSTTDPGYYFFNRVTKRVIPTITWSASPGTLTVLAYDQNAWNGFSNITRTGISMYLSAEL